MTEMTKGKDSYAGTVTIGCPQAGYSMKRTFYPRGTYDTNTKEKAPAYQVTCILNHPNGTPYTQTVGVPAGASSWRVQFTDLPETATGTVAFAKAYLSSAAQGQISPDYTVNNLTIAQNG